jgi:hypothetical protein
MLDMRLLGLLIVRLRLLEFGLELMRLRRLKEPNLTRLIFVCSL